MNTIIERITEAIKDILIGLIKSSLDNMFTSVNEQVGTIAGQVGQTPQGWNAGIFNLIQNYIPNGDCPHCGTDHHLCPVL